MLRNILFIIPYFILSIFSTNALELSSEAEISLLTCSPGDDFYESYGHSALRVKDPVTKVDVVFNYGTFSFSEDFAIKFIKGELNYWVEPEPYFDFRYQYNYEGRSIYEQVLNLTQDQKQSIADYLLENAKPENKYYWYDFRFNNCSSKLRDVLEESTDVQFSDEKSNETFRQMINGYVPYADWYDLGTDVLLGATLDRKTTYAESMFLPDYLMKMFDDAKINGKPLVKEKRTLLDNGYHLYNEGKWANIFSPSAVFWLVLLLFLLFKIYYKGNWPPVFSILFLTILGLSGWFMIILWFFTLHTAADWNLNILWAIPFHFPMAFLLTKAKSWKWVAHYFFICRVILIATLFIWPLFLPQQFNMAVLPLILISLLCISSNMPISLKDFNIKK
ncbi:MAG: DUF4105 domain-containing protein [Chitinophagales bacterium]